MSKPSQNLILASGSPRRKDLMEEAGFTFSVVPPQNDEVDDASMDVRDLTALNAKLKAEEIAVNHGDAIILAADTLVLLGDRVFGKPNDETEAKRMLSDLNGETHQVFTAFCLLRKTDGKIYQQAVATDVRFKKLSAEERDDYHRLINPMDKAGAYAAQEHGEKIIDQFSGSMTNVIGLPMDEVIAALESEFGVMP